MTTPLPSAPNLQHLRDEAKSLLKAHRAGDISCCKVLRNLKELRDKSDGEILAGKRSLAGVQHALALEYGFATWAAMKLSVLGRTDKYAFMHLLCGDMSGQILRNSSVPGDVQVWMEDFIDGPVPRDISEDEWRMVRAEYLASLFSDPAPVNPEHAGRKYERLAEGRNYREVLLWFDACMFDQTIMIHLIDRLSRLDLGDAKLSLICPGDFPGFDTFHGFALLTPEQMASLLETRHAISTEEIALARAAWWAFRAPDPTEIEQVLAGDCTALPYLGAALTRFLQQYPSAANGLSRLEGEVLTAVAAGARDLGTIAARARAMETRPYYHDLTIARSIEELASARIPLLSVSGLEEMIALNSVDKQEQSNREMKKWRVGITEAGRDVLAGRQDHVALNGIDRWLGGVHLQGDEAAWRWDNATHKLVACAADGNHVRGAEAGVVGFVNDEVDGRGIPVVIKETEPANCLYVNYHRSSAETTAAAISLIAEFIQQHDLTKVGPYMCIFHPASDEEERMVVQVAIAERIADGTDQVTFKQEGAMKVASIFWRRSSGDIDDSIEMLYRVIGERGLRVCPDEAFRQLYHNDPVKSDDPLAELQVRIDTASSQETRRSEVAE